MDFFTTLSLIVAGLIFLLTLLAQILYDNYSIESTDGKTDKEKKDLKTQQSLKKFFIAILIGFIGFISTKVLETYNNTIRLEKLNQSILNANNYASALESILKIKPESSLRKYLEEENQILQEKFRQITSHEILLKREEVIPCWEYLIENSNKSVYATNVVSLEEWEKFSPSAGQKAHKIALDNNVNIRRIFIYNGVDSIGKEKLKLVAIEQSKWDTKLKVRLLNGKWFEESPFVSGYLRDLGTQDIVIYDNESVLLTNTDDNGRIISSTLTTNEHRLRTAMRLYEKLWEAAEEIK